MKIKHTKKKKANRGFKKLRHAVHGMNSNGTWIASIGGGVTLYSPLYTSQML